MAQSQVYLFLYEQFDIWKWIAGQRRKYHAGVSLYGREYCYTKDGILALPHTNTFSGAPLKRTFTLAVTNISEMDFNNQINNFKGGDFSATKYSQENNNGSHFAVALIKYLLEINHLEPELEEYLNPSNSSLHALQLMQIRTKEIMENGFPFQLYNQVISTLPFLQNLYVDFEIWIKILELKTSLFVNHSASLAQGPSSVMNY